MSDMVERVAKAMSWNKGHWKEYLDDAREAIAAMREPTDAMIEEGFSETREIEERVAMALLRSRVGGENDDSVWKLMPERSRVIYEAEARAAIAAIVKSGKLCGVCGCLVYPLPTKRET
jgi:hypothetical protein